jgi:hypothetical protein
VARPEHARLQVFVPETYGTACRFTTFYSRGYAFGLDAEGKSRPRGRHRSVHRAADVMEAAKKAHPNGQIGETTICMVRNKPSYSLENKVGNDTYQMMFDRDGKVSLRRSQARGCLKGVTAPGRS